MSATHECHMCGKPCGCTNRICHHQLDEADCPLTIVEDFVYSTTCDPSRGKHGVFCICGGQTVAATDGAP